MALQIRRGLQADLPASPADGELLYATDTGNFYIGVSGSPELISISKYLEVANVAGLIANNTTKYLEVANAASAGTNTSISNVAFTSSNNNLKILTQDGRTFSIDLSNLTDNSSYLEVANASIYLEKANASIYMEVANVNARIANQTTKFLEVANASSVTPDGVSIYLEVANVSSYGFASNTYAASNSYVNQQIGNLVANTASNTAVQKYLEVANAAATIANNTTQYLQVANVSGYGFATESYVDTEVAAVVNSAPATLNTLNELAAALNDDANFASTVTTNLGQKLGATATVTLTGDVTAGATAFSGNAVSLSTTVAASVTNPYLEVANVTSSVHGAGFAANSYVVAQDNAILANVNPRIISVVGTAATANTKAVQALADAAAANTRAEGARTIAATANTRAGSALGVAATANTKAVQALADAAAANTRAEGARTLAVSVNTSLNAYKANTNPRFDSYLQVANVAAKVANLTTQFLEVANVVAVIANNTTKYLTVANSAVFQQAGDAATTYLPLTGGQLSGNLRIDSIGGSSGVHVTNGAIEIFTATGSPAYIDFYCETNNAHRARLKSPAHGDYSGDVDITLPTTTGTVALTSQLTQYLQVANVVATIANNTTKYLEVANAASAGTNTSISNVAFTSSNNNLKILTADSRTFSIDLSDLAGGGGGTNTSISNVAFTSANNNLKILTADSRTFSTDLSALSPTSSSSLTPKVSTGTGDGSTTTFTSPISTTDENSILVSIDGVMQRPQTDYTVSGTTVTFDTAPLTGSAVMVRTASVSTANFTTATEIASGNGSKTTFTSPISTTDENDIIVTVDGIVQRPQTDYTVSGTTVTFSSAPLAGTSVAVRIAALSSTSFITGKEVGSGDGSTTTFTSPISTTDENEILVTVDGVIQRPQTDYTVSGTTVTFGSAPLTGTAVMVRAISSFGFGSSTSISNVAFTSANSNLKILTEDSRTFSVDLSSLAVVSITADTSTSTANGTATTFTSPLSTTDENQILVTIDGILQTPQTDYTVSGTTVTLDEAPANNSSVVVRTAAVTSETSGLQGRGIVTGTTSSLADAAEADLNITGFKSYALLSITTDRAARVRLYVSAATRTADASRAEGVDASSGAGLIAEVITTGADTVIISPGAFGFNLESSPTTTIPCRVTNKSGGTSTVQVDLNILQLEA